MRQNTANPRCEFIVHLGLLSFHVNLIAALLKISPHAVVPFRKRGHDDALLDRPGVVNEREGGGEVDLSNK